MDKKEWSKGLQWGAWAWLGYVAACSLVHVCHAMLHGVYLPLIVPAVGWLTAFILTWTRWSRAGVTTALLVQAAAGTMEAASYEGPMRLSWALTFWLPMCLPLLPLLFTKPERPQLTLARFAIGRRREAVAELAGWRWLAVAAGLVLLNRGAWRALGALDGAAPR